MANAGAKCKSNRRSFDSGYAVAQDDTFFLLSKVKGKSKNNRRSPSGMTTRTATAKVDPPPSAKDDN
jgi:hypothetical protein